VKQNGPTNEIVEDFDCLPPIKIDPRFKTMNDVPGSKLNSGRETLDQTELEEKKLTENKRTRFNKVFNKSTFTKRSETIKTNKISPGVKSKTLKLEGRHHDFLTSSSSSSSSNSDELIEIDLDNEDLKEKINKISDFDLFYNITNEKARDTEKPVRCLIHYNNKAKIIWDVFIGFLLLIVCLFIPANLAFVDKEPLYITIIIGTLDCIFLVDMVFCFFTTYQNEETMLEITDRKTIVFDYLKSWFLVDLASILPINMIVEAA
jgi:hypothetical protein